MSETQREKHRWPFDPMQPGDHEPVQLPEELHNTSWVWAVVN